MATPSSMHPTLILMVTLQHMEYYSYFYRWENKGKNSEKLAPNLLTSGKIRIFICSIYSKLPKRHWLCVCWCLKGSVMYEGERKILIFKCLLSCPFFRKEPGHLLRNVLRSYGLSFLFTPWPTDQKLVSWPPASMQAQSLSPVQLFVTPWTVALQAPLSMGFSRQEYWSGLPLPPPGYLPKPGIEPTSLMSPALAGRFFTISITWGTPSIGYTSIQIKKFNNKKSKLNVWAVLQLSPIQITPSGSPQAITTQWVCLLVSHTPELGKVQWQEPKQSGRSTWNGHSQPWLYKTQSISKFLKQHSKISEIFL